MKSMNRRTAALALTLATLSCCASWAQSAAPAKPAAKATAKPAVKKTAPPSGKSALDKATLEAYVRNLLLWTPQIEVVVGDPSPAPMAGFEKIVVTGKYKEVSLDEVFYVSKDGQKIVRGEVYDVAESPFVEQLRKLHTDSAPNLGTPGARVNLVIFTDFECPYCKEEAKMLRENLLKNYPKDVRLYFKEFPLEAIHPWARAAAEAGRCVYTQSAAAFWDYHDWAYENQTTLTAETLRAKVLEWGAAKGLDTLQLSGCIDKRQAEADVARTIAEARSLRVNQTPTMFLNGRPLAGSLQWEQLKTYIDWELEHNPAPATDACCTLSLPTPGNK
jgi:protein-disulfide isomerase